MLITLAIVCLATPAMDHVPIGLVSVSSVTVFGTGSATKDSVLLDYSFPTSGCRVDTVAVLKSPEGKRQVRITAWRVDGILEQIVERRRTRLRVELPPGDFELDVNGLTVDHARPVPTGCHRLAVAGMAADSTGEVLLTDRPHKPSRILSRQAIKPGGSVDLRIPDVPYFLILLQCGQVRTLGPFRPSPGSWAQSVTWGSC
jgi:hypothetical protein